MKGETLDLGLGNTWKEIMLMNYDYEVVTNLGLQKSVQVLELCLLNKQWKGVIVKFMCMLYGTSFIRI